MEFISYLIHCFLALLGGNNSGYDWLIGLAIVLGVLRRNSMRVTSFFCFKNAVLRCLRFVITKYTISVSYLLYCSVYLRFQGKFLKISIKIRSKSIDKRI